MVQNPYQNYQNPYQKLMDDYYERQYGMQSKVNTGITWVQGIEGAKSIMLKSGETALLMDSEDDRLFIKTCDEIGKPTIRVFRLTEEVEQQNINNTIDTSSFVKKDEIYNIVLDILGGMANGSKRESVQPANGVQQQTTVQNTGNAVPSYQYQQPIQ